METLLQSHLCAIPVVAPHAERELKPDDFQSGQAYDGSLPMRERELKPPCPAY